MKPIKFKIENTTIVINPRGYTYRSDENQRFCQIGIQPLLGDRNEYRLGTIFLQNFYTSLDYDKDLIAIGLNQDAVTFDRANIIDHAEQSSTKTPVQPPV